MHSSQRFFMEPSIPRSKRTPSFSSSLLDAIYRSIDESDGAANDTAIDGAMTKKQSNSCKSLDFLKEEREKIADRPDAMLIENWVEKKSSYRGTTSSDSSSSDSSSRGIFSSSEAESYGRSSRSSKSEKIEKMNQRNNHKQPKHEGFDGRKLTKTKLKSLTIYEEFKKAKQPVSPSARLTTFLNSIFSYNAKKVKICSVSAMEDVCLERRSKPLSSSCSPAASFSRSCFRRKPSSTTRGNNNNNYQTRNGATSDKNNGLETSVRFCPLSMILNEEDDDDDDDDAWSYSSSDLFELDHRIGTARYREELPVYETTDLKTNQAIAKFLIL